MGNLDAEGRRAPAVPESTASAEAAASATPDATASPGDAAGANAGAGTTATPAAPEPLPSPQPAADSDEAISRLVEQIKAVQTLSDSRKAESIGHKVTLGGYLADLQKRKEVWKKGRAIWGDYVKTTFRLNPRDARRLTGLHKAWGALSGTAGSAELFAKLPDDRQVLAQVRWIPTDELPQFLAQPDLESLPREEYNKRVKLWRAESEIVANWDKVVKQSIARLGGLDEVRRQKVLSAVKEKVDQLLRPLSSPASPAVSNGQAAADTPLPAPSTSQSVDSPSA